MNAGYKSRLPWDLAFSFARAIQEPALEIWRGEEANLSQAQQALYHRARCNRAARRGAYDTAMETNGSESPLQGRPSVIGVPTPAVSKLQHSLGELVNS
jgi:fructose-bisphosphate aldolase class I